MRTSSAITYSGGNLVIQGGGNFSGDVTAFSVSDERLKININPIKNSPEK